MLKSIRMSVVFLALASQALAAQGPATVEEAGALETAVMNQHLMVAAFQCNEVENYNRFVTVYRSELQSSDAILKTYFVRQGQGEAGYDRFKTKAANLWALEQARHSAAFCADARALFAAATAHQGRLAGFVASLSSPARIGNGQPEARFSAPISASVDVGPQRATQAQVVGVPAHSLPAMDYRREARVTVPVPEVPSTGLNNRDGDLTPRPASRKEGKMPERTAKTSYRIGDYQANPETVVKNSNVHTIDAVVAPAIPIDSHPPVAARAMEENASKCLKVESNGSYWGFRNSCNFAVQFSYCIAGGSSSLTACERGPVITAATGSVAPHGFGALQADTTLQDNGAAQKFRWLACSGGSGEVVAQLMNIDPPAGRCERTRTAFAD